MSQKPSGDEFNFGEKLLFALIVVGLIVFGLANAEQLRSQSQPTINAPRPSFEVASIKPNHSGDRQYFTMADPRRFTATAMNIKFLIEFAYNVKDFQLSGGPSWINSAKYDIDAKLEDSVVEELLKLPNFNQRLPEIKLMLQSLLADRFKLKLTHETKQLPVLALVVAKNGVKLTPTTFTSPDSNGPKPAGGRGGPYIGMIAKGKIAAIGMPVSSLADVLPFLPELAGRVILDETGLKGFYDFTLQFTPETAIQNGIQGPENAPAPDSSGPSIFTALQDQLGLKLESTKGPVDIIVIEHIEEPSEN